MDNGKVIWSAVIAAGTDMSLHVVARLLGKDGKVRAIDISPSGKVSQIE